MDEIWDLIESVSEGFPTYFRFTVSKLSLCLFEEVQRFQRSSNKFSDCIKVLQGTCNQVFMSFFIIIIIYKREQLHVCGLMFASREYRPFLKGSCSR